MFSPDGNGTPLRTKARCVKERSCAIVFAAFSSAAPLFHGVLQRHSREMDRWREKADQRWRGGGRARWLMHQARRDWRCQRELGQLCRALSEMGAWMVSCMVRQVRGVMDVDRMQIGRLGWRWEGRGALCGKTKSRGLLLGYTIAARDSVSRQQGLPHIATRHSPLLSRLDLPPPSITDVHHHA